MTTVTRTMWVGVWTFVALLLVSMLSFPLGFDQAIFEAGGAAVGLHGAIPFRDFLELKQPLIFYVYGLSTILFGRHEWSPRLLDIIYHGISLIVFYRILRREGGDERLATVSVLLYAVSYVGSGFWMTMEPESYALLPQLLLMSAVLSLDRTNEQRIWMPAAIAAISLWALIMLKITLVIVFGAVLVYLFITRASNPRQKSVFVAWTVAIFGALLAVTAFVLARLGALDNLVMSIRWLGSYASYYPLFGIKTFVEFYYHTFPSEVLTSLSPTFVLLAILFVTEWIRERTHRTAARPIDRLLLFCMIGIVVGLSSVAFERKAFNYQFTRLFWAFIPVVAASIVHRWDDVRSRAARTGFMGRLGLGFVMLLAFVYSSFPRVIDQTFGWGIPALRGDTQAVIERERTYNYDVGEMRRLSATYKPMLAQDGQLFVWGNAAQLYLEFGQTPPMLELVNAMFMTSHTPSEWTDTLAAQWQRQKPMLFICEQNDARPLITRTSDDSYAALLKIPSLRSVLETYYEPLDSTTHYRVYRRRTDR
ncbi:MAG: glycosyltransferase family 39 protein [Bacteroidetes bacterium]|nr:glycosyltransferase family 39 protein [Bacteroidota bacterium]